MAGEEEHKNCSLLADFPLACNFMSIWSHWIGEGKYNVLMGATDLWKVLSEYPLSIPCQGILVCSGIENLSGTVFGRDNEKVLNTNKN